MFGFSNYFYSLSDEHLLYNTYVTIQRAVYFYCYNISSTVSHIFYHFYTTDFQWFSNILNLEKEPTKTQKRILQYGI